MAKFVEDEIKKFVRTSPSNRIPGTDNPIFDEPLVRYADGNDPLFSEYKTIISPTHLTPHEAMAKTFNKSPEDIPAHISIISWVLPITAKTRESNRKQKRSPSPSWTHTRNYGERFNNALREHEVKLLTDMGYMTTAPALQPYFRVIESDNGLYSNWSERHIAYVAGHGTFSLSDGFITELGIAHRCGSIVTDLVLPVSPRTATSYQSNCLFYANDTCRACIARCPAEAITENGHNKRKCEDYTTNSSNMRRLMKKYHEELVGCGLCQTKVPCEYRNPARKLKTSAD